MAPPFTLLLAWKALALWYGQGGDAGLCLIPQNLKQNALMKAIFPVYNEKRNLADR